MIFVRNLIFLRRTNYGLDKEQQGFAALVCYINGNVSPIASAVCGNFHGEALGIRAEAFYNRNIFYKSAHNSVPVNYSIIYITRIQYEKIDILCKILNFLAVRDGNIRRDCYVDCGGRIFRGEFFRGYFARVCRACLLYKRQRVLLRKRQKSLHLHKF